MVESAKLSSLWGTSSSYLDGRVDEWMDVPENRVTQPISEYEHALERGFPALQFDSQLERQYLHEQADARLTLIRHGAFLVLLLSNCMLVGDWLMVADQFQTALKLRLLVYTPIAILLLLSLGRMRPAEREWSCVWMSLLAGGICVHLSIQSQNHLAPAYLVCLSLILLFNVGVLRLRFWMSLGIGALVFLLFVLAVCALNNPPVNLMWSLATVLLSIMVFTLYANYRLEHENRSNWLMHKHEALLLNALNMANSRLDQLSRFDALTGLANRRHVDQFLAQLWSRSQRAPSEVAVLMIDIDYFKQYNDQYGHLAGDDCLKEVAQAMGQHMRDPHDLMGRYGGEEFIAVLPATSQQQAQAAAERIRQAVWDMQRGHLGSPILGRVTVSIGVATSHPYEQGASPEQLIAQADQALYQAKARGRNRVEQRHEDRRPEEGA
jgi:diguanylate cyclase (GGDEF)-like protein